MASEPAVVFIRSWVSMLSLIRIGMPCSGPRGPRSLRSRSSAAAISSASGLSSMTDFSVGPFLSMSLMRSVYFSTSDRAEYFPDCIPRCRSGMVSSSSSNAGGVNAAVGLVTATASTAAVVCRKFLRFMQRCVVRGLVQSDFERVKEPIGGKRILRALWIPDNDLIRPATHHVNARLVNHLCSLRYKLQRLIAIDLQRPCANERRLDAFDKVVAVCRQLALLVEIETWIVIDPPNKIDVVSTPVAGDEQVRRVRTMFARCRVCFVGWRIRHQDRKAA